MIVSPLLQELVRVITDAEDRTVDDLRDGQIADETSFTGRFIGALRGLIPERGLQRAGYQVLVRSTRPQGPHSPEREFGADMVSVFDVTTSELELKKGFLVQAKMAGSEGVSVTEPGDRFYPRLTIRRPLTVEEKPSSLGVQCQRMLRVTPHSYVWVYTRAAIYVLPAMAIASLPRDGEHHHLYVKRLGEFYRDHFQCFIGDHRLTAFDDDSLRALNHEANAADGLLLQVRDGER